MAGGRIRDLRIVLEDQPQYAYVHQSPMVLKELARMHATGRASYVYIGRA